jgi:hypothetical protein
VSISLSLGDTGSLTLKQITDELQDLEGHGNTLIHLGDDLNNFLHQPLSSIPSGLSSVKLQYGSSDQTWTPGPVTFTLSGGTCGQISVLTSGTLLTYTDGFPVNLTLGAAPVDNKDCSQKVPISASGAYLCLELDFTLSGGVSVSGTSGPYGVSADGSASSSITVAFYKQCSPSTTLEDAIVSAFKSFVLPLHPDTLDHLALGDYLHYTFNAKLELGLGATVGIDKVLYAAQYKSDLTGVASPLNIDAKLKPHVEAGAKLSFAYDYTGCFEVLLWLSAPKTANLHLYRADIRHQSLGLDLGVTASADASFSVGIDADKVASALGKQFPSLATSDFKTGVFDPASAEVGKYVTEMNTKMGNWLIRLNNAKASLDAAIDRTQDSFLLTNYTIDLTQSYQPAWKLMLDGRFLEAFSLPNTGVTLDTGSGLEKVFSRATSLNLNLFGKFSGTWTNTTVNDSTLLYAGNNTFHLVAYEGKSQIDLIGKSRKEMDIYFAAEGDLSTSNTPVKELDIKLHVILQATSNQNFGAYIARVVGLLLQGQDTRTLTTAITQLAAKPGTTQVLHLIFSQDTYTHKLQASTITQGKPDNEFPDEQNFAAFAYACAQLFGTTQPQNFQYGTRPLDYKLWSRANILANDSAPPANALPDRTSGGSPAAALVYLDGQGLDAMSKMIWNTLSVAANFMNFCADLKTLAAASSATSLASWQDFLKRLQAMIDNEVNVDFIAPTAYALANLCGGAPASVSGPAPGLTSGTSVGITMTY